VQQSLPANRRGFFDIQMLLDKRVMGVALVEVSEEKRGMKQEEETKDMGRDP
jgi:hypothetical protein